jgi:RNA polymerase sigma-70 factor (ECF subfamily)
LTNVDKPLESSYGHTMCANSQSFDVLYHRYVQRIYQYAYARLNNSEEAADATQQVFLQAWRSLDHFRPESSFAAWLFGIARNIICDVQRGYRLTVTWESVPETDHPLDLTGDPEMIALFHETKFRIQELIHRLSPEKQELLALYRDGKLTIAETAIILGKRPETVRKQLSRTIKALREQYHATNS